MEEKVLTGYPSKDKQWLYSCSKQYGSAVCMEYFSIKLHYPQLYKKIDMVASALLNYGIAQGEMVSVCLPNIPEVAYVFYAINKVGAVANMIDPQSSESQLEDALINTKSKLLIAIDTTADKFAKKKDYALDVKITDKNVCVDWEVFLKNYGTHIEDIVLDQNVAFAICNQKYERDKDYLASEIMTLCSEQLPEYALPVDVRFVERLPLTPIGKIDYRALEQKVCQVTNQN